MNLGCEDAVLLTSLFLPSSTGKHYKFPHGGEPGCRKNHTEPYLDEMF